MVNYLSLVSVDLRALRPQSGRVSDEYRATRAIVHAMFDLTSAIRQNTSALNIAINVNTSTLSNTVITVSNTSV